MKATLTQMEHDHELENEQELFENDSYIEAYGDAYKSQIRRLRSLIIEEETGQEQFVVFDPEPALGKSVKTNKILKMYLDDWGKRKSLVVKRFKEDVWDCVYSLEGSGIGENSILGITSENWNEWNERLHELERYQVLVITHERYKKLCLDDYLRSCFTKGRHTLIIDEKMDFPVYTFSADVCDEILLKIPYQLRKMFLDICDPLYVEIAKMELIEGINLKVVKCQPSINKKLLESFVAKMNENRKHINMKHRQEVFEFVEVIVNCYNNTCFYNGGRISCFNKKHRLWGVENNIILDANGSLDHSYVVSPRVRVEKQDKLINHEDCTIVWVKFNTSRSAIEKKLHEYYQEVASCISSNHEDGDRTLVVAHNKHEDLMIKSLQDEGMVVYGSKQKLKDHEEVKDQEVAVNHFGNLIGKNQFRDFEVCWVVGTPNIPLEQIVLKWYQYSEKRIRKDVYTYTSRAGAMRFDDQEIENMRVSLISGEMYQCAKRIQRGCHPNGWFFIVTNTQDVFSKIADQFLQIERIDDPEKNVLELPSVKKAKEEKEKKKADTNGAKLASYLLSLEPKTYTKKEIREKVGFTVPTFTRVLKSSIEINELAKLGIIKIWNKTIERLPYSTSHIV